MVPGTRSISDTFSMKRVKYAIDSMCPLARARVEYLQNILSVCDLSIPLPVPQQWLPQSEPDIDELKQMRELLSLEGLESHVNPIPVEQCTDYCSIGEVRPLYFEKKNDKGSAAFETAIIGQRVANLVLHDGQMESVVTRVSELFANTPYYQVQSQAKCPIPHALLPNTTRTCAVIYQPLKWTESFMIDEYFDRDVECAEEVAINPYNPAGLILFAAATADELDRFMMHNLRLLLPSNATTDASLYDRFNRPPFGILFGLLYEQEDGLLSVFAYFFCTDDASASNLPPAEPSMCSVLVTKLPFHPIFSYNDPEKELDCRQAEILLRSAALFLSIKSHLVWLADVIEDAVKLRLEGSTGQDCGDDGLQMSRARSPSAHTTHVDEAIEAVFGLPSGQLDDEQERLNYLAAPWEMVTYNDLKQPKWRKGPASAMWESLQDLGCNLAYECHVCIPNALMNPTSLRPTDNRFASVRWKKPGRLPFVTIPSAEYARYLNGQDVRGVFPPLSERGFPYGLLKDDTRVPNFSALPDNISAAALVDDAKVAQGAFDLDGVVTCLNHLVACGPLGPGDSIYPPLGAVLRYGHRFEDAQHVSICEPPGLFTYLRARPDIAVVVSIEAQDRGSAAAALQRLIQPSLSALTRVLSSQLDLDNRTHDTTYVLPEWAFIIGHGYYKNTISSFAHFPRPSLSKQAIRWTYVSVHLGDKVFNRCDSPLSAMSLMAALGRLRRYSSELSRQILSVSVEETGKLLFPDSIV